MAYRLLGLVVWKGAKWFLRRRYRGAAPKAALAGGGLAAVAAAVAFGLRRRG